MTLTEMIDALDALTPEELNELRDQVDLRLGAHHSARGSTPAERVERLLAAAAEIRDGFSDLEWAEVVTAMNFDALPVKRENWKV